jgi:hypothetical protein
VRITQLYPHLVREGDHVSDRRVVPGLARWVMERGSHGLSGRRRVCKGCVHGARRWRPRDR